MSAAALRALLHPARYRITLIESDEIGTVGVGEATLPHYQDFNDLLRIDEAQFMRETQATFKLGIEFRNWGQPGDRYIHPFGTFGEPWGGVDFQHHWMRARQRGQHVAPFQEYSYAIAACRRNAFDFPGSDRSRSARPYAYAYHFDAGLYARLSAALGDCTGSASASKDRSIDVALNGESGDIDRLTLKSGSAIEGDFFVDCQRLPLVAARRQARQCVGRLEPLAALRSRVGRALRASADSRRTRARPRNARLDLADPAAASHRQRLCVLQPLHQRGSRRAPPC